METTVQIFSISTDFIATHVMTVDLDVFDDLKKHFKIREQCQYLICFGLDHKQNAHKYHYYDILNSNFEPINDLNGIYKMEKFKLVESWRGQWRDIFLPVYFHSDIYDRGLVPLTTSKDQIIKNVQQIAIVLQALHSKNEKLNDQELNEIRNKIDQYLGLRRI